MKANSIFTSLVICMALANITSPVNSKTPARSITEEVVTYMVDGVTLKGVVTYDKNIKVKRPAVIIVHEWWGLNDYLKMRARKLAELGYISISNSPRFKGYLPYSRTSFTIKSYVFPDTSLETEWSD